MELNNVSEVQKFYGNTNVFITGSTGFLGMLLIEKLLRACPDISNMYLLIRSKKNKDPNERVTQMFKEVLFERLHKEQPDFFKKITVIPGNCEEQGLGISNDDRQKLINEIDVIFHVAALVRFAAPLRKMVHNNIRSTNDLLEIAQEIKNLKAFVYVSTAYSNCNQKEIDECFYTAPNTYEKLVDMIKMYDDNQLELLTPSLLKKWPNIYVYTKAVAEGLIKNYSKILPITVVRPSIVFSTIEEPVPGWINNFYGPVGLTVGVGIGFLHVLPINKTRRVEIIPADFVVNCIIASGSHTDLRNNENGQVKIYNCVSSSQNILTWGIYRKLLILASKAYPLNSSIWYCCVLYEPNKYLYTLYNFLFHTIPGWIGDGILTVLGKERMLTKYYTKLNANIDLMSFFTLHAWKFHNRNARNLWSRLSEQDQKLFPFNMECIDWNDYLRNSVIYSRRYLIGESLDDLPQAKKKYLILKTLHYSLIFVLVLLFLLLLRFVFGWIFN